jgi:hypothetical protein
LNGVLYGPVYDWYIYHNRTNDGTDYTYSDTNYRDYAGDKGNGYIKFQVSAQADPGSTSSAELTLNTLETWREQRREIPAGTAVFHSQEFDNYDYVLGAFTTLASGTVSYMAVDAGT